MISAVEECFNFLCCAVLWRCAVVVQITTWSVWYGYMVIFPKESNPGSLLDSACYWFGHDLTASSKMLLCSRLPLLGRQHIVGSVLSARDVTGESCWKDERFLHETRRQKRRTCESHPTVKNHHITLLRFCDLCGVLSSFTTNPSTRETKENSHQC